MTDKNTREDRLIALENELAIARAELMGLQGARSVRTAKFIRHLISSRPAEMPKILKTLPDLIKRYDPPRVEQLSATESHFSSVHHLLPLFRYPNINVATIGKLPAKLFNPVCNSFTIGTQTNKLLDKYSAVQLIAVEASSYQPKRDRTVIADCIQNGARLVVIHKSVEDCKSIKKDFPNGTTYLALEAERSNSSVGTYIDIYELRPKFPSVKVSDTIRNSLPAETSKRNSIIIITQEYLDEQLKDGPSFAQKLTSVIANGHPVILRGNSRPKWLSDYIKLCASDDDETKILDELNQQYAAEQYAIRCSRDTILRFNMKTAVDHILLRSGIIDQAASDTPSVGVILASRRPENIEFALSQLEQQTIRPVQIALMLHGITDAEYKKVQPVIKKSKLNIIERRVDKSVIFGEVLNRALDTLTSDFVTKIDDDDYYSPNHLLDLYTAHIQSCADFVGKWNNWVYLVAEDKTINWVPENANSQVKHLPGGTFLVRTSVLKNLRFGKVPRAIDSELFRRAERRGALLYSTHRYNYVRKRGDDHTYQTTDADFKSRAHSIQLDGLPLEEKLSA